jgi:hypothetical protein
MANVSLSLNFQPFLPGISSLTKGAPGILTARVETEEIVNYLTRTRYCDKYQVTNRDDIAFARVGRRKTMGKSTGNGGASI